MSLSKIVADKLHSVIVALIMGHGQEETAAKLLKVCGPILFKWNPSFDLCIACSQNSSSVP